MSEHNHGKMYSDLKIEKLPKSEVSITGNVPTDIFESFRAQAVKNISNEVEIDGFRKGNVPEKVLAMKVGDMTILYEMAELALDHAYPHIVIEEKIDVVGQPKIEITKIAKGNPLEFKITTAVYPEFKISDYKKIAKKELAKKVEAEKITDQELEKVIEEIRNSKRLEGQESAPELNLDFVKTLGNFESVEDFKNKIRKNIEDEKNYRAKEKKRLEIAEAIIKETDIELPESMIEIEAQRSESQFMEDINRMGIKLDDYLSHLKKTIEDLRKEWKEASDKKAKLQIILNKIAEIEKIVPDEKEVTRQVQMILEHYKDANEEQARIYAESVLKNDKVFEFLESLN